MNRDAEANPTWSDGVRAAALFAVDPRTGGIWIRSSPGPVRDRYLGWLRVSLPADTPIRKLPPGIADDRLLGGLDLAATLLHGRPVAATGLLVECNGGVVLASMAERLSPGIVARLNAVLDNGEVLVERDGFALRSPATIGVVALDEGIGTDEHTADSLLDRLAFAVDLDGIPLLDAQAPAHDRMIIAAARHLLGSVSLPQEIIEALAAAAAALGVVSLRVLLLALRAARANAALDGRKVVCDADAMLTARLVLAPRATRLPIEQPADQAVPEAAKSGDPGNEGDGGSPDTVDQSATDQPLGEIVLAAAKAAIPAGLLASMTTVSPDRKLAGPAGQSGAPVAGSRGRPIGVRRGEIRSGSRLNLIETLRAAAPWQKLRRAASPDRSSGVIILRDDIRITRFRARRETTTIFLIDASGSAALNRLAEAKGAVELVLADCYIRRDRVALIAFRGSGAEMLLPPTNSLVRARRCLAELPGGGGTPLASGIAAAAKLADATRRKGQSPYLVLLSDGRANVALDGLPGRARAQTDALAEARRLRAASIACVVVDTAPRPLPQTQQLAVEMRARYLPLPYADAQALARAVRTSADA